MQHYLSQYDSVMSRNPTDSVMYAPDSVLIEMVLRQSEYIKSTVCSATIRRFRHAPLTLNWELLDEMIGRFQTWANDEHNCRERLQRFADNSLLRKSEICSKNKQCIGDI
eukprot:729064_1